MNALTFGQSAAASGLLIFNQGWRRATASPIVPAWLSAIVSRLPLRAQSAAQPGSHRLPRTTTLSDRIRISKLMNSLTALRS